MKALKIVFASLFFFTFLVSSAFAGISIGLPRSISAEEIVKAFQGADKDIPSVAVTVDTEYAYEPGSIKKIPKRYVIKLYSSEKFLNLFRWCNDYAFIRIELDASKKFIRIIALRPYGSSNTNFSTLNLSEEKRTKLEELLKEVYKRLQEK